MIATTTTDDVITRCSFARLVTLHCRFSGHDPEARDLDAWLASVWPMVTEDMNPGRWARAYLVAVGLQADQLADAVREKGQFPRTP